MLLAAVAIVAGTLAGWLSGRRLPARRRPWRAAALMPAGAAMVLAGGRWIGGASGLVVLVAGYGLLAVFAAANRRRPGLVLVAAGLLANLAVVTADHGMPVRGLPAGVQVAGHHHGLSTRDHLAALADTIRVAPLGETISPGDVLVTLGGAVGLFTWLEPRPVRRRTGPAGPRPRPAGAP
jgi:hypothetical protein